MPMPDLAIDRLTLQVPGFTEAATRRLALAIADALAADSFPGGDVDRLRVDLSADADAPPERLAERVVAEIRRQRSL